MGGSFKIGRFSGIDVRVHWTFFLLLGFFAFLGYQASGSAVGALTATVTIVALFFWQEGSSRPTVVLVHGGAFAESARHATKAAYPCLREVYDRAVSAPDHKGR